MAPPPTPEQLRAQAAAIAEKRDALLELASATKDLRKQQELKHEAEMLSLDAAEKNLKAIGASTKHIHILRAELIESRKEQEKYNAEVDSGAKKAKDFKGQIFGLSGAYEKLNAILPKTASEVKGFAKELISFKGVTQAADFVVGKFVNSAFELGLGMDAVRSSLLQSTGASYAFAAEIGGLNAHMRSLGLSEAEVAAVGGDLYSSMSEFTQLSKSERIHIANITAALTQHGMASAETAKIMDIATRSLYMTGTGASQLALDFTQMAADIGRPASVIAQDFAQAAPELAKYGSQMIDVFIGLEKQAKQTGISTDRLIGIAAQFDQFDKAGEAVGRLNAIMGGPYLNSIDMLNMKEDERIDAIRRTMDMAGMQFDTLHRFEQQAIALALGMNVDEARRVFGMTTLEYERQTLEALKAEKQAKINQAITDKLRIAFLKLGEQLLPLVNKMIGWTESLSEWIDEATPFEKKMALITAAAVALSPTILSVVAAGASMVMAWPAVAGVLGTAALAVRFAALEFAMLNPVMATTMMWLAPLVAGLATFAYFKEKAGTVAAVFYGIAAAITVAAIAFALLTGGISMWAGLAAVAAAGIAVGIGATTDIRNQPKAKTAGKPKGPKVGDMITDDDGNVRAILNERDYLMAAREGGPILGGIQRGNAEIVKHLKVMNETLTKLDLAVHLDGEKVGSSRSFNKGRDNYLNDKYPPTRQA